MAMLFENEVCGRCGGSGEFSYNAIDGKRCFGCRGSGRVLTARGKAAQAYLNEMTSKPMMYVVPGDVMEVPGTGKYATVVAVDADEWNVGFGNILARIPGAALPYNFVAGWCCLVRTKATGAQRAAALAYQATLDKRGKVRRAVRAAKH